MTAPLGSLSRRLRGARAATWRVPKRRRRRRAGKRYFRIDFCSVRKGEGNGTMGEGDDNYIEADIGANNPHLLQILPLDSPQEGCDTETLYLSRKGNLD